MKNLFYVICIAVVFGLPSISQAGNEPSSQPRIETLILSTGDVEISEISITDYFKYDGLNTESKIRVQKVSLFKEVSLKCGSHDMNITDYETNQYGYDADDMWMSVTIVAICTKMVKQLESENIFSLDSRNEFKSVPLDVNSNELFIELYFDFSSEQDFEELEALYKAKVYKSVFQECDMYKSTIDIVEMSSNHNLGSIFDEGELNWGSVVLKAICTTF